MGEGEKEGSKEWTLKLLDAGTDQEYLTMDTSTLNPDFYALEGKPNQEHEIDSLPLLCRKVHVVSSELTFCGIS